jgi:hypothetical protein
MLCTVCAKLERQNYVKLDEDGEVTIDEVSQRDRRTRRHLVLKFI